MKFRLRALSMLLILVGQLALADQSFSVGDCHEPAVTAAAAHTTHAGHDGLDATPGPDGTAHDCSCTAGMHCGLLVILLPERPTMMPTATSNLGYQAPQAWPTALAHRRNPDRPPAA